MKSEFLHRTGAESGAVRNGIGAVRNRTGAMRNCTGAVWCGMALVQFCEVAQIAPVRCSFKGQIAAIRCSFLV